MGILAGNKTNQEISTSSLTEGGYKFHFTVRKGSAQVVSCSKNFITYVYDNTSPSELTLTAPVASGIETSTTVTVDGIEPSHLVELYKGSDCSSTHLQAAVRSNESSETITVDNLPRRDSLFQGQDYGSQKR